MVEGTQGVVVLVAIICAVAVILISVDAGSEMLRRRGWRRESLMGDQPVSLLELRTCRAVAGQLAEDCGREGCEMPTVMRMSLDDRRVEVFLSEPARQAPEPWLVSEDGTRWSTLLGALDGLARHLDEDPGAPELFVSIGRAAAASVFVNLAVCPGLIGLEGSPRMRHLLIRRWTRELTEPQWRHDVNVLVAGAPGLVNGRAIDASGTLRADSACDFTGGLLVVGGTDWAEEVEAVLQRAHADGRRKAGGSGRRAYRAGQLDLPRTQRRQPGTGGLPVARLAADPRAPGRPVQGPGRPGGGVAGMDAGSFRRQGSRSARDTLCRGRSSMSRCRWHPCRPHRRGAAAPNRRRLARRGWETACREWMLRPGRGPAAPAPHEKLDRAPISRGRCGQPRWNLAGLRGR